MDTIHSQPVALAAAVIALILWAVRIVVFVRLHTMRPPAHLVHDTVSDYANGSTGRLFRVMSVVTAGAWTGTAFAVLLGLPGWDYRIPCFIILLVAAVTPLLMIAAPIPPQGARLGARGIVHYLLAIINFAAAYSPADRIAALVRGAAGHDGSPLAAVIGAVLGVLAVVMLVALIALIASLVLRKLRRIVGLTERAFLWTVVVFYTLFTVALVMG
ncbi:MAG: hypothetical protein JSS74_06055 [Actinobacteria bacterium]|nr:hypothetical protein [Actinomycetota bacterium]